jgi:hypothetical protein
MELDYKIEPLDEPIVAQGFELPADPDRVLVKCIMHDGDIYRECSFVAKKNEVNSKEFILNVVSHFFICNASMKAAKQKIKSGIKAYDQ